MFRKIVLFAFITNFMLKSNDAITTGEDYELRRVERGISFFAPLRKLFKTLKQLIIGKPEEEKKVEEPIKPKSAFSVFLDEMLKKKRLEDEMEKDLRSGAHHPHSQFPPKFTYEDRPEMNAEQLITAHGFLSESHTVLTEDGYMITMHRVLGDNEPIKKRVVILHHGLLGSSEDWLLLGTRALPYMLIDNGFDVWLLNARGNRYSRIHINRRPDWPNFWDFSFHEMGIYDLPAVIKYITEITKSSELHFIGHSMGGTALLVLLSSMPQYNNILRSAILLAPLAYMYHAQGPIKMLSNFYRVNGYHSLDFLGQKEFMRNEVFPEQIVEKYCKGESKSCLNSLLLLGNGGGGVWGRKLLRDILAHVPAGGSVKTVLHYVQLVRSGYFQMYNYGDIDNNLIKYRNTTPPSYNLKAISLPIALFSSPSDWLASASDIQTLLGMLRDVSIHHVVKSDNFGHFDFLWSPDATELIYNFILPLLDQRLPIRDQRLPIRDQRLPIRNTVYNLQ